MVSSFECFTEDISTLLKIILSLACSYIFIILEIISIFHRTNVHMITTVAQIFNIVCKNVKIQAFFIQRGHLDICNVSHFTHMWNMLAKPHHFTKSLTLSLFIEMPITSQEIKVSG